MTKHEALVKELENSDLWFKEEGDAWTLKYNGTDVRVEMRDDRLVRVAASTGVKFAEDHAAELYAMMAHITGWKYKVGEFQTVSDGTIEIYLDREVGSGDPLDSMVRRMANSAKDASGFLQAVAQGDSLISAADSHPTL